MLTPSDINRAIVVGNVSTAIRIGDNNVSGPVVINRECNDGTKSLVFENITFGELVTITDVEVGMGVKFIHCTFRKDVIINKVIAKGSSEEWGKISLVFDHCLITGELQIMECELERGMIFSDVKGLLAVGIEGNICNYGGIIFDRIANLKVLLFHKNTVRNIRFDKTNVKSHLLLRNNHCETCHFIDSVFSEAIMLYAGSVKRGVSFQEGAFFNMVEIDSVDTEGGLSISGGIFHKSVVVNYENDGLINNKYEGFKRIFLQSAQFDAGIFVEGTKLSNAQAKIDRIQINTSQKQKGDIVIRACTIVDLEVTGTNHSGSLTFKNVEVKNLILTDFTNYSKFQLIGCKGMKGGHLSINFSNLGSLQLLNSNLSEFDKVNITNSDLTNISFSNVLWFNDKQLNHRGPGYSDVLKQMSRWVWLHFNNVTEEDAVLISLKSKREVFRQLKHASEKQSDRIQALKFQKEEMKSYSKELRLTKKIWNPDRIIGWLSSSNQYGQNWFKPVGLAFIFTFIFWIIITTNVSEVVYWKFTVKPQEWFISLKQLWISYDAVFIQMLNPVHSVDKLFSESEYANMPTRVWWFDYAYRLILAYLIFQTISAFRKFIKS